jgi:alpha-L-fucosidase
MTGSLEDRSLPAWFDDAKLGIAICWSAATIPAFGHVPEDGVWPPPGRWWEDPEACASMPYAEEYLDAMAFEGSPAWRYHREHYPDLRYDDFPPMWRALHDRFDPEAWAELMEQCGARYVTLYTKLGDGFLLWPSAHRNPRRVDWQARRDIVGEVAAAVRARGIRFGVYYCDFDWTVSDHEPPAMTEAAMAERKPRGKDYEAMTEAHWRELVERYEPSILWSDGGYPEHAATEADDLFRWYYERVPDGVVNDRFHEWRDDGRHIHRDFRTYEFKHDFSNAVQDVKWEATRPIGYSFGYNRQETDRDYVSAADHLRALIDIVARGGNYLLHFGPTATGKPPWLQAERLLAMGWWLRRNGAAIYGTRRWERPTGTTTEGLDVRFTASEDAVHAIVLGTPKLGSPREPHVELDVRLDPGARVTLADQPGDLCWKTTDHGVRIDFPEPPDDQPAVALHLSPRAAVR